MGLFVCLSVWSYINLLNSIAKIVLRLVAHKSHVLYIFVCVSAFFDGNAIHIIIHFQN